MGSEPAAGRRSGVAGVFVSLLLTAKGFSLDQIVANCPVKQWTDLRILVSMGFNATSISAVDPEVGVLVLMYRSLMAIPTLAVTVRRLHDIGKSGWWCVLWLFPVPILGWLVLIPLLCKPSRP